MTVLGADESIRWAVYLVLVMLALGTAAYHLNTRCPVCRYRLGYQRSVGAPPRCERCGASFQTVP